MKNVSWHLFLEVLKVFRNDIHEWKSGTASCFTDAGGSWSSLCLPYPLAPQRLACLSCLCFAQFQFLSLVIFSLIIYYGHRPLNINSPNWFFPIIYAGLVFTCQFTLSRKSSLFRRGHFYLFMLVSLPEVDILTFRESRLFRSGHFLIFIPIL